MKTSLTIGINLNNLTVKQYQWIMSGLSAVLDKDLFDFPVEEQEEIQQFFEKLIDIEKRLIELGEM